MDSFKNVAGAVKEHNEFCSRFVSVAATWLKPEAFQNLTLLVEHSLRDDQPNATDVSVQAQPTPAVPPCPVVLNGPGAEALISEVSVQGPVKVAYLAVQALVQAWPRGLNTHALNRAAGAAAAQAALRALAERSPEWAAVLAFPSDGPDSNGVKSYRIKYPRSPVSEAEPQREQHAGMTPEPNEVTPC